MDKLLRSGNTRPIWRSRVKPLYGEVDRTIHHHDYSAAFNNFRERIKYSYWNKKHYFTIVKFRFPIIEIRRSLFKTNSAEHFEEGKIARHIKACVVRPKANNTKTATIKKAYGPSSSKCILLTYASRLHDDKLRVERRHRRVEKRTRQTKKAICCRFIVVEGVD